jgi:N-acetylneuraminate synthase/N,N'-diacetyllegionaminate synthase
MSKVLVVLEIGHNHNGNLRLAKLMIEEAKKCKADIAKFQLYDTDKIKKPYQSRYSELKFAELTKEDLKELKEHCDKVGIEFMASAFDAERVQWLEEVGVKRHKLASRSIRDTETIKAMEATKKPIIASLGDWENQLEFPKIKNSQFLYCVAEYPATINALNFPKHFEDYAGFSDHTEGIDWAKESVRRGATIIEKHFTLDKKLPGHNQEGSCDPTEAKDLVQWIRQYERGN